MDFFNKEYEAELVENLKTRAKLIEKANQDPKLAYALFETCKADPIFYFNNFLFTVKNDTFFSPEMPYAIPFNLFSYQKDVVTELWRCIVNKESVFLEKSRQLGLTWLIMGLFIYGFLFHNHKYLIISRTADEVDKKGDINSCFERLRFMLEFTPNFLLPEGFNKEMAGEHNKYMTISRPDCPASINGESANPNASRGGTYNAIFLDEMAFMQDASAINRSASQATPCRIINSTPNGEGNEYYRMRMLAKEEKINGLTLHWSLHPFYTKEWYQWKTKGMTQEQIAQELEISYNLSIEGRVYPKFGKKPLGDIDVGFYEYDYSLPLYISIDNSHGGSDPHAVLVVQTDTLGKIRIIDCLQSKCSITEMAQLLARQPIHQLTSTEQDFLTRLRTYKTPIFIADPYDTTSTWNNTSILNEYKKVGIQLQIPTTQKGLQGNIVEQIRVATAMLHRVQVNDRCIDFLYDILNAKYPTRKETSQATNAILKPVHDFTSHYRTSFEYLCLYIYEMEVNKPKPREKTLVQYGDPITGEIKTKYI